MDITICTTARTDDEGRALLVAFGFPFRQENHLATMAKKALIEKQQRTPKFKVRAYTRCRRCGRPKAVFRKFGLCRICLRVHGPCRGDPRCHQGELVREVAPMTMTDPIADMLTRIRNANTAMHDTVKMPSSKLKESLAGILQREGYIAGFDVPGGFDRARARSSRSQLKYAPDRTRTIAGLRRVSKPGLRIYARADRMPRVLGGMGVAVLSTSQGLMTDRRGPQAPRGRGGALLCVVSRGACPAPSVARAGRRCRRGLR